MFDRFSDAQDQAARIGICVEQKRPAVIESLKACARLCELHVFGAEVAGAAQCSVGDDPVGELIGAFQSGRIDAFVRGINDDFTFQKRLTEAFGDFQLLRLALLRDVKGRAFALGPVSAKEAATPESREEFARRSCQLLEALGCRPHVAVMAACRPGSRDLNPENRRSWDASDRIAAALQSAGYMARNYGIELEKAVPECNFVLPVDGVVGNQVYRTAVFLGGCTVLSVPAYPASGGLFRLTYEDNSRNEDSFEQHVRAAMVIAAERRKKA